MKHRISSILVALYLLACIVLGGSAQNAWTNLSLQIGGIALIAWAAINRSPTQESKGISALHVMLVCAILLVLVQLVPLPASLWPRLPGRGDIAESIALLGYPLRPFPISEMPYDSVLTLFAAIPAIAALAATEQLAPSPRATALAVVVGMVAAIFLGAVQVAGGPNSYAYFYKIHAPGAIGFFANANHMATLLLVGIPMAAALVVSAKSDRQSAAVARYGLGAAMLVLVIVGIALNGSRAAAGLSVPVIIASAAIFPAAVRWRGPALALSIVILVAGVGLIMSSPIAAGELASGENSLAATSRGEIWRTTGQAIGDSFPVGTGLGSFQIAYHRYENPDYIGRSFVNHAHNDFLEVALELGAGGIALMIAFLIWWVVVATRIWTSTYSSPFDRAATIATAAILAHSFVDFPLRTPAISALFAASIGLMMRHVAKVVAAQPGDLRPTRHIQLR
jgi:O-antigen ligase